MSESIEQLDWQRAEKYLEMIEREYNKLIGVPGVDVSLALYIVIQPLRVRFNRGERTPELHAEIMGLE